MKERDSRFETTMKLMSGEETTLEERRALDAHNFRYNLVRVLYMEKRTAIAKEDGSGEILRDFHFTPGDGFEDTPIYDIVHSLLEMDRKMKSGELKVEPLDFGDLRLKESTFPETGKEKIDLKDL